MGRLRIGAWWVWTLVWLVIAVGLTVDLAISFSQDGWLGHGGGLAAAFLVPFIAACWAWLFSRRHGPPPAHRPVDAHAT